MGNQYLEYRIINNRTGLLGDIASLLGLLKINILTIASIGENHRGLLIELENGKKELVEKSLSSVSDLDLVCLRAPTFLDILALKHGKKIRSGQNKNFFHFERDELDLLIDFLGGFLQRNPQALIGFKGLPRVGKTETAIAAAVHANKHWQLLSSTLLRKVARTRIAEDVLNTESIFIIDAITTFHRSPAEHIKLVKKVVNLPLPRIIEHPEIFVQETDFTWDDFNLIIELNDKGEDQETKKDYLHSFNSFDIS